MKDKMITRLETESLKALEDVFQHLKKIRTPEEIQKVQGRVHQDRVCDKFSEFFSQRAINLIDVESIEIVCRHLTKGTFPFHMYVLVNGEIIVDGTYQQFSRSPVNLEPKVLIAETSNDINNLLKKADIPESIFDIWEHKKSTEKTIVKAKPIKWFEIPLRILQKIKLVTAH